MTQWLRHYLASLVHLLGVLAKRSPYLRRLAFAFRQRFPSLGFRLFSIYKRKNGSLAHVLSVPNEAMSLEDSDLAASANPMERADASAVLVDPCASQRTPLEASAHKYWSS